MSDRYYIAARRRGTTNSFRRVYPRNRVGHYVWAGPWGATLVRTGKAMRVLPASRVQDFKEWCAKRGLEWSLNPVHSYPNSERYSKHYTRRELDCRCGCTTPQQVQRELALTAQVLERVRAKLGVRVPVLSGYRCPTHNARVGGVRNSQHLTGRAFDLNIPAITAQGVPRDRIVQALLDERSLNGVGSYPQGGLHGDRRNPPRVRW